MSKQLKPAWPRPNRGRRRTVAVGGLVVTVALVAVAGALAARSASKSGPVTVSLIEEGQGPRVTLLKKMIPVFERSHPNIKVKLIFGPAEDTEYQTKVIVELSSGHAPDVISLTDGLPPADLAASGYLLDLTQLVNAWPAWKHFYPNIRQGEVQSDGKIYSIPREETVEQIFYRKSFLRAHHISMSQPQTWSQLLARMVQAKDALGGPSVVFPAGKAWGSGTGDEGFIPMWVGTSSPPYDTKTKKWIVASPGLNQVFNWYLQLTKTGVLDIPPLLNVDPWVPTKYKAFVQGKLAFSTGGTWSWFFDWGPKGAGPIPNVFKALGVWNFPKPSGGSYVYGGTNYRWAISAKTAHPQQAWQLVQWLSSPVFIAQNAVAIGTVSPRNDVNVAPYTTYPVLKASERQLPESRGFARPSGIAQIEQVIDDVTESIITGKATTVSEAAKQFANEAKQLLGSNRVEQR
jgi:multiple sugar transport system substrate-binding protein